MALEIIVLAAGAGKRMHSDLPKVLHRVAGSPMLLHVLQTSCLLSPAKIHVVVGHQSETVIAAVSEFKKQLPCPVDCIMQQQRSGTAHAVMQALPALQDGNTALVLYADTPLTPAFELERLTETLSVSDLAILTAVVDNPFGYGRILRDSEGNVTGIVEEKDASDAQRSIREINTGMIAAEVSLLRRFLPEIKNNNAQNEFYLTDLAGILHAAGKKVTPVIASRPELLAGVNSKSQLAAVERLYQKTRAEQLMNDGLILADPERFDLRGSLKFGRDCRIDTNVIIEGDVVLGDHVEIGTGCVLKNVSIGDRSVISPYTIMENSTLKVHTTIGPFARLRPGNILENEVHVGNFVEVKNSHIFDNTKAGHLTYIGDADIGADTNIGAGTITCNYDGANKHRTVIGKNVFIGSDTQLVAPVTVEDGATVGAGATVTRTVPANSLMVSRARPFIKPEYQRPVKKTSSKA